MKTMSIRAALCSTASMTLVVSALLISPASAQENVPNSNAAEGDVIIVTGSRIPKPNLESVAPLTLVSKEDIKLQGTTKIEDLLNTLPSVFASQSSALANGADGTATVDLRGLGTTRTLVLVNGRRLLPGDPSPISGSAADINMIPASLLKRVEVLTGGASSTYGADAVAGVVNFIMDDDFEGFKFDGQYGFFQHNNRNKLITPLLDARANAGNAGFNYPRGSVSDGDNFDGTLSFGTKFGDGRGHLTAYFGYRKTKPVLQSNRDYSACTLQNTGAGKSQCGGSLTNASGTAILFDPTVNSASSTVYTFLPGGGFENGTTRYNFAPTNHYQRPDERYTAGFFANYEVNDAIKPYLEFMFMDDNTTAQIAPSGDFGNTYTVNCDNPLMSAQQRSIICAPSNLINGVLGTFPLATAASYNPNPGNAPTNFTDSQGNTYNQGFMQLLRRNVEGGSRLAELQHTNYRAVIGSKGTLDKAWSYDAFYQYGRSNYSQVYSNEFSAARLARALNVVTDTRTGSATLGQAVCRSVIDGSDPNCVPYNVFGGAGAASAAAVNYLSATGFQKGHTTEQVANMSFTGRLGEYGIQTPWAKDGAAVNFGFEWRKESLDLKTDNAFATGDLTGQGGATLPISGSFRVYELFGEADIPIVQNGPVDYLALSLGYRKSWYKTSADRKYDTDTFKIGLEFAPVKDIRFRGAFNRAVRAPNIQELFATPTVGLNGSSDPCAGSTITATDYGCIAQGLAVGGGTTANPAGQYNGLLGGNPDLKPEKATTKTVGFVFQPGFLPRFAFTVDWYDIKVKDAIQPPAQDALLKDCVANATATFTPLSCGLIHRDVAGSLWLTPNGYVNNIPNNLGSVHTRGIEVSASYAYDFDSAGTLSANFSGNYLDKYEVNNGLTQAYDCAGLYGPVCSAGGTTASGAVMPKWRHKARLSWLNQGGDIGVSFQWRYTGKVSAETTMTSNQSIGGTPYTAAGVAYGPGVYIAPVSFFDLSASYTFRKAYTFRIGVNNVFDKSPPLVTSGSASVDGTNLCPTGSCNGNTYPASYDALGRFIYSSVTLNF
jgi:outer membrane receptor protein involved in Fe transport